MDLETKKKVFGEALAADRASKGLSQQALADDLDVAQQSLSKWEAGVSYPRDFRIIQIGEYFGPESHTAKFAREIREQRHRKIVARTNGVPLQAVALGTLGRPEYGAFEPASDLEIPDLPDDAFRAMEALRALPPDVRGRFAAKVLNGVHELGRALGYLNGLTSVMQQIIKVSEEKDAEKNG